MSFLIHTGTDKASVVNRALSSLHEKSFEIKRTVPLTTIVLDSYTI